MVTEVLLSPLCCRIFVLFFFFVFEFYLENVKIPFLLVIGDNDVTVEISWNFPCAGAASELSPLHVTPSDQPTLSGLGGLWTTRRLRHGGLCKCSLSHQ